MTPEQIELHRKRFEEHYAGDVKLERKGNGNYIYMQAHIAWNTWISAIESIEIEIPEKFEKAIDDYNWAYNTAISDCKDAIQSLGLKVKER